MTVFADSMYGFDPDRRFDLERAKINVRIDRSFTCFKGVGSISKSDLSKSMWLGEEKKKSEYI